MTDLPEPLAPPDSDLRDFAFMPVDIRRLLTSETWILGSAEAKVAALTLWMQSWHQVPAGSLPDNDKMLAHLSEASPIWEEVREHVMRGWIKCSDGRLYHPVVCEKANEAWRRKQSQRDRSRKGNSVRWASNRDNVGDPHAILQGCDSDPHAILQGCDSDPHAILQGCDSDPHAIPEGSPKQSFSDPKVQGQGEGQVKEEEGRKEGLAPLRDATPKDALPKPDRTKRRTRLPDDWAPTDGDRLFAANKGVSVETEAPKFRDYHLSRGSVMADWAAAWRTWCGNVKTFTRPGGGSFGRPGKTDWLHQGDADSGPIIDMEDAA